MKRIEKIAVHVCFWAVAYFVLLGIFASSSERRPIDHIYTAIFILTLMIPVAINEFYLLPKFLFRNRYIAWVILIDLVLIVSIRFNYLLFDRLIDYVLPGYYFISYYDYLDLVKFFVAFVGLTTLISLSIDWLRLQEERKNKTDAEFKALVSQVNPHFLFNGLTVLYTLSIKDSRETSSAIIKLSDILRYVIYPSPDNTVKLSSEIAILRDYIDLQRYRVHPTTQIDFISQVSGEVSVSPMLFLPLVENAFKHGVHNETGNAFVRITLLEERSVINFTIANNRPSIAASQPGIGLKNLRERLQLLYPGRHKLEITETENAFTVHLQISL